MTIKRRKKVGATLLVASAGVTVSMATSCVGAVSGNLMAPPLVQLCVEVEPETAEITLSDSYMYDDTGYGGGADTKTLADGECTHIQGWSSVTVSATAEGYQDYTEEVAIDESNLTHTIEMTPEETTEE